MTNMLVVRAQILVRLVGRPARTFVGLSVSVPRPTGKPDLSLPKDFLVSFGGIGARDDAEDDDDDEVDESRVFTTGGGEANVIVSSCSSASLSASVPSSDAVTTASSSSCGDFACAGVECRDGNSSGCDDVDPRRRQSCKSISRFWVSVHSSVNVQVRFRGVVPVGMSSRAP